MSDPIIPGRVLVQPSTPECQHAAVHYRCDDRNGFLLRIVKAADGDFHLSIVVDPDHEDAKVNCRYISGSVRIRMPMVGGGMHEALWDALASAVRAELEQHKPAAKDQP